MRVELNNKKSTEGDVFNCLGKARELVEEYHRHSHTKKRKKMVDLTIMSVTLSMELDGAWYKETS